MSDAENFEIARTFSFFHPEKSFSNLGGPPRVQIEHEPEPPGGVGFSLARAEGPPPEGPLSVSPRPGAVSVLESHFGFEKAGERRKQFKSEGGTNQFWADDFQWFLTASLARG